MSNEHKGMALTVMCALLWSLSAIFIKLIPWNAFVISGARSLLTGLVLFGYMRLNGMKLRFTKRTIGTGACIAMIYVCYLNALQLTSAANAIVLEYTAPIYVLIFSAILYKQKIKRGDALAVLLTMAGIALFFFDQLGEGMLLGNILALIAGVCLAGQFLLTGHSDEQTRFGALVMAQILTVLIGVPFALTSTIVIEPAYLLYIAALGILQFGLPNILYVRALRYCKPLTISLIAVLEPMLTPVWVFLAMGETPSVFALFGAAIVLATVTIWCVAGERAKRRNAAAAALVSAEPTELGNS